MRGSTVTGCLRQCTTKKSLSKATNRLPIIGDFTCVKDGSVVESGVRMILLYVR